MEDLYRRLATGDCDPGVAALLACARRAHRRLERDGFRADQAADPAVVAAAAAGLAPVYGQWLAGGFISNGRLGSATDLPTSPGSPPTWSAFGADLRPFISFPPKGLLPSERLCHIGRGGDILARKGKGDDDR